MVFQYERRMQELRRELWQEIELTGHGSQQVMSVLRRMDKLKAEKEAK